MLIRKIKLFINIQVIQIVSYFYNLGKFLIEFIFAAPSKPLNLTIGKVGDSSARLRWQEPEFPNGMIQGYRVYFQHTALNITEMRKAQNPQPVMDYVLQNLSKNIFIVFNT